MFKMVTTDNEACGSPFEERYQACSLRRCCFFLLLFLCLAVTVVGAAAGIIFFLLKPRKPEFNLHTLRFESYKIEGSPTSDLYLSSNLSLRLNAGNNNKFGIGYGSSTYTMYTGIPIGVVQLPAFYQPPHSQNVSVDMEIVLDRLNLHQVLTAEVIQNLTCSNGLVQMRVTGNVKAFARILHINFPKVQVIIDCQIGVNYEDIVSNKRMYDSLGDVKAVSMYFPSLRKKCSIAFEI